MELVRGLEPRTCSLRVSCTVVFGTYAEVRAAYFPKGLPAGAHCATFAVIALDPTISKHPESTDENEQV